MVKIANAVKTYGKVRAVDNVSFEINRGEIVGLLGPNGAGKTTLMRLITGYFPVESGTIQIAGMNIQDNPLEVKELTGYLPETLPLYNEMQVADYLNFVAEIKGVSASERPERIFETIQETHIEEVSRKIIGRLSRGYRQRVALAQALVSDPDLLILDEPTRGLDPKQIVETRELIRQLSGNRTVLLSSHILPEVSLICKRVLIMHHGRIVAADTTEGLLKQDKSLEQVFMQLTTEKKNG